MENQFQYMDILKAIADETRMAILQVLKTGSLTAGQIEKSIGKSHSTTSQQLKNLVEANILSSRKDGTQKFFQINNPQIFEVIESIKSYLSTTEVKSLDGLSKPPQILLMGLDNSGKTSILLSFLGHKNILSFTNKILVPTQKLKHMDEVLNGLKLKKRAEVSSVFYEYGGQVVYREEFKKKSNEILKNWNKLIYVIDIQNFDRFGESLDYMKEIVDGLDKIYNDFDLDIFFHKFDPGIEIEEPELYSKEMLNEKLIDKIRLLVPSKFRYAIYKTSIFTIFQKNLLFHQKTY
jgi:ArsR family transcriptional regulator